MKKFATIILIIVAMISVFTSAVAEETVSLLATKDHLIGIYFNQKVEIDSDDVAFAAKKESVIKKVIDSSKLDTNRYERKAHWLASELESSELPMTSYEWVEKAARKEFNGNVQDALDATIMEGKMGKTHRIWNRHARQVAETVLVTKIGGRKISVAYVMKDNQRVYGLILNEQTVVSAPKKTDPAPSKPADVDPAPVWEDPKPAKDPAPVWEDPKPAKDPAPVWEDSASTKQETPANQDWDSGFNF